MIRRREFLKKAVVGTAVGLGRDPDAVLEARPPETRAQPDKASRPPTSAVKELIRHKGLLDKGKMRPQGQFDEAKVPDTLDLAERAELILNCLLGEVDPLHDYSLVRFWFDRYPPRCNSPLGTISLTMPAFSLWCETSAEAIATWILNTRS